MRGRLSEAWYFLRYAGRALVHGPHKFQNAPHVVARLRALLNAVESVPPSGPAAAEVESIDPCAAAEPIERDLAPIPDELRPFLRITGFAHAVARDLDVPYARVYAAYVGSKRSPRFEDALKQKYQQVGKKLLALGGAE